MKAFVKPILIAVAIAALPHAAAGQVRVVAQVDTSGSIYVGESFAYRIIIDGEEKPGRVDLTPIAKYNPQSLGGGPASQISIRTMNGQTTRTVHKRYVMNYALTVAEPGRIILPPLNVSIDGRDYQTNPLQLNILKPGTTDLLDLEITLSEQKCYVGQPVIMTVKFYISADIGDFSFNIPAFTSDAFDLEDPQITDPQARQFRLAAGLTVFVSQFRTTHNGRQAILLSFSKVLIPKRPGDIRTGPASVSADVAVGRARSSDPFDTFSIFSPRKQYKRFMVASPSLTLTVLPLPEQGRPAQFYGLVGRYTISASAAPTKVNVGDPITLTVKIGGGRYLKPIRWPDLEQIPGLAENFKMPAQKAAPETADGFKIFTQTIRANNDKVTGIPPIPLAYFDADAGRYVVAKSDPINLEVAPTTILTNADLEGRDITPAAREVEAIKKGLSANYESTAILRNTTFSPLAAALTPLCAVLWSVPLLGLTASGAFKLLTSSSPERAAQKRRRQAAARALRDIKKIASESPERRHESLVSAMKQYVGDRFDRLPGSLTADDCRDLILAATGDAQAAEAYRDIVTACETSRYASARAPYDPRQSARVIDLLRKIDKKAKR